MSSRVVRPLAVAAAIAVAAAACGGEATDSGDRDGTGSATSAPRTAAAEPNGADRTSGAEDSTVLEAEPGAETATTAPEAESTAEPGAESGAGTSTTVPEAESGAGTTTTEAAATEPGHSDEAPADGGDGEEPSPAEPGPEGPSPIVFDDPRDGIFDEFQAGFDRSGDPFAPLDAFCHAHDPAPDRVATGPGIEADSVSLVHLRTRLEEAVDIGFALPVGDVAEMFDTFTAVVNEQCGGVRGRMIELHTVEAPMLGATVDADRNAACLRAVEDLHGVILLNSSGFQGSANLCIVEQHETAFISVQGQSEEFMRRGGDLLVSLSPTLEESLRWLASDLADRGLLDGRTIGVAAPDSPGDYEAVQAGLVDTLAAKGVEVAVFDVIGCEGGTMCAAGTIESVQRMREAGVDVFFNVLNVLSAPNYILEMHNQGFAPGDVQFYASDFNAQAGELVSSKIVAFGSEAAGNLYNGALIVDDANTGAYRLDGYELPVFNEMCNDTYAANSPSGASHQTRGPLAGIVGAADGGQGLQHHAHRAAGHPRRGRQPHPSRHLRRAGLSGADRLQRDAAVLAAARQDAGPRRHPHAALRVPLHQAPPLQRPEHLHLPDRQLPPRPPLTRRLLSQPLVRLGARRNLGTVEDRPGSPRKTCLTARHHMLWRTRRGMPQRVSGWVSRRASDRER